MAITTHETNEGESAIIHISGRFDFSVHRELRLCWEKIKQATYRNYIIDLAKTDYIDSSALGMLLILRDEFGGDKSSITIKRANPEIKSILMVSDFQKYFTIE